MKKKMFMSLTAAVLSAVTLCTPFSVSAAERVYQLGDIDMDGVVSVEDAWLALGHYVNYLSSGSEIIGTKWELTADQIKLGNVDGKSHMCRLGSEEYEIFVDAGDAQLILNMYTDRLAQQLEPTYITLSD